MSAEARVLLALAFCLGLFVAALILTRNDP